MMFLSAELILWRQLLRLLALLKSSIDQRTLYSMNICFAQRHSLGILVLRTERCSSAFAFWLCLKTTLSLWLVSLLTTDKSAPVCSGTALTVLPIYLGIFWPLSSKHSVITPAVLAFPLIRNRWLMLVLLILKYGTG